MKTILLIDDDEWLRKAMRDTLTMARGYQVLEAGHGREARKILASRSVNLIITDMIMPDEEGLETILHVRRLLPEIPIIAISGGARIMAGDYLRMAETAGADQTLAKPFSASELLDTVDRVMDSRPATAR